MFTSWQAEPVKYLIEEKHFFDNGKRSNHSHEYVPEKNKSVKVPNFSLIEGTKKVVVKTYTLEHLSKNVEIEYKNGVITDIFVGIRNEKDIAYIGRFFVSKQFDDKNIDQYGFKKNRPGGYNGGYIQAPGWPTNHGIIIDEDLMEHFETLKILRPNAAGNLEKCISYLSKPGPDYNGGSQGTEKFKLNARNK
jgi:hypothetical protein